MPMTLRAARINADLSRKDAAERIGISIDTLGNYERGKSFPDIPVLKSIERVYGINYNEIIFTSKLPFKSNIRRTKTKQEKAASDG